MSIKPSRNAIVVGCGAFGAALSKLLEGSRYNVTVVDMDPAAFERLEETLEGDTITGDGSNSSVLEEAGITRSSLVVAATGRDTMNVFIAELASEIYQVTNVFARIENEAICGLADAHGIEVICPHQVCLDAFCDAFGMEEKERAR